MRVVRTHHENVLPHHLGHHRGHLRALVHLDAAKKPAARQILARRALQLLIDVTDILHLVVEAPRPKWKPPKARLEDAKAQAGEAIEHAGSGHRRDEAHRRPWMGSAAPDERAIP